MTCSVFAPNPNRILDQILRNTTEPRSSSEAAAEAAELQEEAVDHAAEDTRSEPTSIDRAVGARSKQHAKAAKQQPQHHVRNDSIVMSFSVHHSIYIPRAKIKLRQERERGPNSYVLPILPISPFPVGVFFRTGHYLS